MITFRGPLGPKNYINGNDDSDGLFNTPVGETADTIVELGMTAFTYYNNPGSDPTPTPGTTDPTTGVPQHFYNYISGSWQDGTRFTYGGEGYNPSSTDYISYAFTEAPNDVNGWSMFQEGLPDGDRRTIQASGPFRLDPSAKNELIIGVVWVPNEDYPGPSIARLVRADETAQALFDNCFNLLDGPDAPDACFIELDQEIIITLSNEDASNNFNEDYAEIDPFAPPSLADSVKTYIFEGYQIYQLVSPSISSFDNPDEARLIYQVDVKNDVSKIYNWFPDETAGQIPGLPTVWVPKEMVDGQNVGVGHTFRVTSDQFGLTDSRLVNHKKYYFSVVAYGFNEWEPFDNTPPGLGQDKPYVTGRRNIGPEEGVSGYTVIPRPIVDRTIKAEYGDGAIVTRLDGVGAGGRFIDVSEEMREVMISGDFNGSITYTPGNAPIDVKVYNPLDVVDGTFELFFIDEDMSNNVLNDSIKWRLTKTDDATVEVISTKTIEKLNEETLAEFGFSIAIAQTDDVGAQNDENNGAIGYDEAYVEANVEDWLTAAPAGGFPLNYLSPGAQNNFDPSGTLASMAGGAFYPYRLLSFDLISPLISPAWMNGTNNTANTFNLIETLPNIDIVLTSDKSKWSRCVIVETANVFYYGSANLGLSTDGGTESFDLRAAPSVSRDGGDTPDTDGSGTTGMGWFPGYAVDVETGQRLNIFFGENTTYDCESVSGFCDDGTLSPEQLTGRDMMWNPTDEENLNALNFQPVFPYQQVQGGHHFIYVSGTEYDECATIREQLSNSNPLIKSNAVRTIKWAGFPVLTEGSRMLSYGDGLIPSDVVLKLRVDSPFKEAIGTGENEGVNKYLFTFDGAAADLADTDAEIESQLDAINVVPNPYYGFSAYETSQFSNNIKITNLPAKCTVTIFTLDGKFVRQYIRDEARQAKSADYAPVLNDQISPALEWDLTNDKRIPVSSGVYLIHVDADGLGERVIKWFGVARQFDPSGL